MILLIFVTLDALQSNRRLYKISQLNYAVHFITFTCVHQCVYPLYNSLLSELTKPQEIAPSVEAVAWARFSQISLKDIVLASIHFDAGVWVPDFYILQTRI
jgi:hypothetical protein